MTLLSESERLKVEKFITQEMSGRNGKSKNKELPDKASFLKSQTNNPQLITLDNCQKNVWLTLYFFY